MIEYYYLEYSDCTSLSSELKCNLFLVQDTNVYHCGHIAEPLSPPDMQTRDASIAEALSPAPLKCNPLRANTSCICFRKPGDQEDRRLTKRIQREHLVRSDKASKIRAWTYPALVSKCNRFWVSCFSSRRRTHIHIRKSRSISMPLRTTIKQKPQSLDFRNLESAMEAPRSLHIINWLTYTHLTRLWC